MRHRVDTFSVTVDACLRDVMACIDRGARGIALVLDAEKRLLATLTDGDIRRAILAGHGLDLRVGKLLQELRRSREIHPVVLRQGSSREQIISEMKARSVRQVPLVDESDRVVDLAVLDDMVSEPAAPLHAVVMAGGFGKRLMPLTAHTPKPLLQVGDRPLIERLLKQLKTAGVSHISISTHYHAEKIEAHLGNGREFGVEVGYISEQQPLGTAGALALVAGNDPLLVINGDILTNLDFRALHSFHSEHGAAMTVAVREYGFNVPYGVVETDGLHVTGVAEKPTLKVFVNAGIYLISPSAKAFVPAGENFDMPQLITRLVKAGRRVVSFPIWEYWLDIGRQEDFERAQEDIKVMGAAN